MNNSDFGSLQKVELRQGWTNEASGFTPWLARDENIKLLGSTIGIELEVESTEKEVGSFRADILCKDTVTDTWVLIENQLEKTDHVHLGQILTYAAGLKAVTVVWIAKQFTEEHRAALDWLNEVTDERMNFFALEIELWKINDSPVAPKFNVVSKPNGWSKNISSGASGLSAGRLTEGKTLQLEYWNSFQKYLADHNSFLKPQQPRPQHWTYIAIGRRGFVLIAIASLKDSLSESFETNEIRAELNITIPHSEVFFALLKLQRETIEKEFGDKLVWHNPEDANYCKIYIRKSADLRDKSKWDEQHQWLMKNIEGLHTVFSQRIKQLEVDENNLSS